jgi:site-specific DNA recombinase
LSAIERVDLRKDGFNLAINLAPLISRKTGVPDGARLMITKSVPLLLKRRGVELRIVLEGEATSTVRTDPTLIKAIARGRRWFTDLASNAAADTLEIAKREGLRDSYVRRLIPLALLAPAIVEAICAGSQPPDLTTEELTRRAELSITWDNQQRELGIGFGNPSN